MRSSGFSCTGTLICFTVDRRVAKLWKPEERQRSSRMMPLAAAVPSPRRKLFPGLGYPSAVALERVAVYLDADAGFCGILTLPSDMRTAPPIKSWRKGCEEVSYSSIGSSGFIDSGVGDRPPRTARRERLWGSR